ncbi:MAG: hypothetical protein ACKVPY_13665 [Paracoccaceae bacterium]
MKTSGQMGAPAPSVQRQADNPGAQETPRKKPGAAGSPGRGADSQQGGDSGASQFTDWASI